LETLVRFLIGGAAVSLFALLGDLLRPKGFAGLFAAAPSVALATLAIAGVAEGRAYASREARSMAAGEIAFIGYAVGCVYLLGARRTRTGPTSALVPLAWGVIAASLYLGALR
jgi:uncharacterized membrane protein (GlpM family)